MIELKISTSQMGLIKRALNFYEKEISLTQEAQDELNEILAQIIGKEWFLNK